jgi:uncharacterized membrane protein
MIKPKPMFYVLLFGIFFWFCIFYFGFFQTVISTIIISAVAGIVLKLYEERGMY